MRKLVSGQSLRTKFKYKIRTKKGSKFDQKLRTARLGVEKHGSYKKKSVFMKKYKTLTIEAFCLTTQQMYAARYCSVSWPNTSYITNT